MYAVFMRIDPQIRLWLGALFIFLLVGGGIFYGMRELSIDRTMQIIAFMGYGIIFLVGLNVFQGLMMRHQAEGIAAYLTEEMSSSRELFMGLFRNSPVPYVLVKANGEITMPNTAAIRLFGVEQGMLDGKNIFEMLTEETGSRVSFIAARLNGGNFINDEELQAIRYDGTQRWVILSAFPFGKRHEGLITLVDITKQKEIEIAKTEFVSLASHQLRTPISSMKWNIELLASDKFGVVTEKQQAFIAKIERGLVKMNNIIKDFLDASQLELGTFATKPSEISLPLFFDDVADEFVERVNKKGITFQKNYTNDGTTLVTDEQLLHMIVSNITSNAVKYTPDGGTVVLGYSVKAAQVVITVADSGMGIPQADQEKLFSKFFRAGNARSQVTEGTGLGLYIVKEAVEMLKGQISFVSAENQGTEFTIVIPR